MTNQRTGLPTGRSSDDLRQYLAEDAQRELDELRAEFDVRLAALETALSRRDSRTTLERVVTATMPGPSDQSRWPTFS